MLTPRRSGDFELTWGESLRWDDRREQLDFIDCATQMWRWLDHAVRPLHSMKLPTAPAGVVFTNTGQLVDVPRLRALRYVESGSDSETGVRASGSTLCNAEQLAVLLPTGAK